MPDPSPQNPRCPACSNPILAIQRSQIHEGGRYALVFTGVHENDVCTNEEAIQVAGCWQALSEGKTNWVILDGRRWSLLEVGSVHPLVDSSQGKRVSAEENWDKGLGARSLLRGLEGRRVPRWNPNEEIEEDDDEG